MWRYDKPIKQSDRRDFIRYMKKNNINWYSSWEQTKLYNTTDCKMYLFRVRCNKLWRAIKDTLFSKK